MKRILYIASILLLGAVACNKEAEEFVNQQPTENSGLVAVTMGLRLPVSIDAMTRAGETDYRDHLPKINAIRVAVFGTSSYPQAYAYAEPVIKTDQVVNGRPVYTDEGATYATTNDDVYYFKVLLPVYEGEAVVHIVANGDESIPFVDQTENSIMSKMVTTDDVGGYWARVVMPDGILTQLDDNGIMQTDDEGNFIPSDGTAALFEDLVLVRNFAEINLVVPESSGLKNVTWALVNDPVSGSIAPMMGTNFVANYKDFIFDTKTGKMVRCLMELDEETGKMKPKRNAEGNLVEVYETYNGYMVNTALNTLPAAESSLDWIAAGESHFSYERVDPNKTNPTYIMMKGVYGNDANPTYYRVDLMDENVGGYFPLYRNYVYQISIHLVGNSGASTFTEAANRNSGGNVSMSAETKTLTDVSDGFSRMYVEYVEKTFTTGGQKSFWVYYVPDVSNGNVDNRTIEVSVKDMGTALASASITKDTEKSVDTGEGAMYFFNFNLNEQSATEDLVSVLQVKATNGKTGDQKSTLYREITLKVMKKMEMNLSLHPQKVAEGTEKTTVLHIALSDTLQQSMFPLEFYIEDTNRTLNPTGKDGDGNSIAVPVKVGPSIYDPTNTNSYYFIRTVNWDEYEPMRDAWVAANDDGTSTDGIIDFTTQLKTIKADGTTTIWVDNEYFNSKSIDLETGNFSVTTNLTEVGYKAGSATVTVATDEGVSWTATVNNGAGLTRASGTTTITGQGTETFTINYDANSDPAPKTYTITVTADGLEAEATIIQRRAPDANGSSFTRSSFTSGSASSDSEDGYISVSMSNVNTDSNEYLGVYTSTRNSSKITITPNDGVTITEIVITYTDQNTYKDTAPSFNVNGEVNTSGGSAITWTGSSSSAVTYTCGSGGNSNGGNNPRKRIKTISVKYN